MSQPPPLPPRKASPASPDVPTLPTPPAAALPPPASTNSHPPDNSSSPIMVESPHLEVTTLPPPLPPRKPSHTPEPILISSNLPRNGVIVDQVTAPTPTPTFAVTPATPAQSRENTLNSSLGQAGAESASPPDSHNGPIASPITATSAGAPQPPRLPPRPTAAERKPSLNMSQLGVTIPPAWFLLTAGLMILAYLRISFPLLLLAAIGSCLYVKDHGSGPERGESQTGRDGPTGGTQNDETAVAWVNHALYALFPLISTDILAPFIDLLEDALIEQLPPVVTSVRLASPSLGAQPLVLTSLRPMSDQEWFSNISRAHQTKRRTAKSHRRAKSSSSRFHDDSAHSKNASISSAPSPSGTGLSTPMSRSRSASSAGSAEDSDDVAREAQGRRKRDRILQKISRKQSAKAPRTDERDPAPHSRFDEDHAPALDPGVEDGDREHGGSGEQSMDEDDPNAGQYVNYQVGFEYKRNDTSKQKGWGLHLLAYFGWGIKGVGNSEIPVYIDMISVSGTLNLRLLLSATPPFVRTGTFSLPSIPDFDISAQPLTRGTFNAMELPGMKRYVRKSIAEVAEAFVRPKSYSLDIERLLLGREASVRTTHVGVLHIVIHGAEDLPKADTMGSCDPYVSISFSKFHKPLFSTRTIGDTRNPQWEEQAFILVAADAIEAGEELRLRCCDSDRFSADDAIGVVQTDLAELVDTTSGQLSRRRDALAADHPGMRSSGYLSWSVRFCPLWQLPESEIRARAEKAKEKQEVFGPAGVRQMMPPLPWLKWIEGFLPEQEGWTKRRAERRKETADWFTGEKDRDEIEVDMPPPDDYRSGILQFHIHQCNDLQVESLSGSYSASFSPRLSAAGGKPALQKEVDTTPAESPDPPSAYCEVYLNDQLIYRTRTKQVTPMPYFNAVSERFVRDWKGGKVTFVIRDERNREHDPILGLVSIPLKDAFATRSQITRWYPLVAGLGWGRIRLSLLFKPLDITLPREIATYEVATLHLTSLSLSATAAGVQALKIGEKGFGVILETESDRYELSGSSDDLTTPSPLNSPSRTSLSRSHVRNGSTSSRLSIQSHPTSAAEQQTTQLEWDLSSNKQHVRLAVQYRHSCSLLLSFVSKSAVLKKKKVLGLAVVYLGDVPDSEEVQRAVPIFSAEMGVEGAMRATETWRSETCQSSRLSHSHSNGSAGVGDKDTTTTNPIRPARLRSSSSTSKSSLKSVFGQDQDQAMAEPLRIGYVDLAFVLRPGVSRAHRRLAKRDLRFAKVYQVWEAAKEVENGLDHTEAKARAAEHNQDHNRGSEDESESGSDSDDDDDEDADGEGGERNEVERAARGARGGDADTSTTGQDEDEDEADGKKAGWREHSHALHKRHKGVFQLKIARTGRYVKDQIQAKIYTAAHKNHVGPGAGSGSAKLRGRGSDLDVEQEGISSL